MDQRRRRPSAKPREKQVSARLSDTSPNSSASSQLGADILSSFNDIKDRINNVQRGTIGEALHEVLFIMREIERILIRIEAAN